MQNETLSDERDERDEHSDRPEPLFGLDAVPFRLPADKLKERMTDFNRRPEIVWFGLVGSLHANTRANVRFTDIKNGFLGGGGLDAINGGVIAAGFDAVCVLAALAQFDVKAMATLTLQVQYLRLATNSAHLEFQACVTKSARHICFVQGMLVDKNRAPLTPLAVANATLAPLV